MNKNRLKPCFSVGQMVGCGLLALGLVACGDKGSSGPGPVSGVASSVSFDVSQSSSQVGTSSSSAANTVAWRLGEYKGSTEYKARCVHPRSGINPETNKPFEDQQGSIEDEKMWLRSITHETYLWADEVIDTNPAGYSTLDYFDVLKSHAVTDSGKPKDQFHFYKKTSDFYEGFVLGNEVSYGVEWGMDWDATLLNVQYVQPNSAAEKAGIKRGMQVVTIDGVAVAKWSDHELRARMYPSEVATHTFEMLGVSGDFRLIAENTKDTPVSPVKILPGPKGEVVGYLQFNSFNGPSEGALITAVNSLNAANVSELVLDLRYNGGGYIAIASRLAYMVAGAARADKKVFAYTHYSAYIEQAYPESKAGEHFLTETKGLGVDVGAGVPLPQLRLNRLYVLTGERTCSASELLINALRGIDFPVIQVGGVTCGKPYGFHPLENCGYTYSMINFQSENAKHFGDYADGFSPLDERGNQGSPKGCLVEDDLQNELGDAKEKRLAAALTHIGTGQCATTVMGLLGSGLPKAAVHPLDRQRTALKSNAIW